MISKKVRPTCLQPTSLVSRFSCCVVFNMPISCSQVRAFPQLLKMSKKNSDRANLASPRDLRNDPWSHPMSYSHAQHHPASTGAASSSGHLHLPIAASLNEHHQQEAQTPAPPMPAFIRHRMVYSGILCTNVRLGSTGASHPVLQESHSWLWR